MNVTTDGLLIDFHAALRALADAQQRGDQLAAENAALKTALVEARADASEKTPTPETAIPEAFSS